MFIRFTATVLVFFSLSAFAEPIRFLAQKNDAQYLIVGSIHVGNNSLYPLPKSITEFLSSSDGLFLEADIRQAHTLQYPKNRYITQQVLSKKQKQQLKALSQQLGLNQQQMMLSPPWVSALTLQLAMFNEMGLSAEKGVDKHFIELATKQNLAITGLETLQYQIDILANAEQDGAEMIVSALTHASEMEAITQCLIDSWKQGDLNGLGQLNEKESLSQELKEAILDKRNLNWANVLNEHAAEQKGKRFVVVVGALHLFGENNLIDLMKQQGFSITQRYQPGKANCAQQLL